MTQQRFADAVLSGLKDFQRATVDHVFERLYAPGASGRFLVADEVGLGKTMIAKGVVAKSIDHLIAENVPRIDIVYICSNGDIARQNMNRLLVEGTAHTPLVSRLTMLPRELKRLKSNRVNFVSFTPATSFDVHDGLGQIHERVLLYALLRATWGLGSSKAGMNVFQGHAGADRFRRLVAEAESTEVHADSVRDFATALEAQSARDVTEGRPTFRARFDRLCESYTRSDSVVSSEMTRERYRFVGDLRAVLASSCVNALEPDLVILDEFQRFGHLLDRETEDDAARLARALFDFDKVRVLLLSATPYKMYTTPDEASGEDHYADFVRTLRFLERGERGRGELDAVVAEYRDALMAIGDAGAGLRVMNARRELEARLRSVMVRTERLASTTDRNGMLEEKKPREEMRVAARDLHDWLAVQRVARTVEADDTLELWKSTPFVLNFADKDYKLGRKLDDALDDGELRQRVARCLAAAPTAIFSWADAERYAAIDPGNARMRALLADVVDSGAYRMMWIPPSLPYYRLGGAFGAPGASTFTKRLVFSAWRMVPRAIAALVSYEVERRMLEGDEGARNTPEARRNRGGLLRFSVKDGRFGGMPVLALLYPSLYLSRACNPEQLVVERARERAASDDGPMSSDAVSLEDVLAIARDRISVALGRLGSVTEEGTEDERWYWAAPLLLDRKLKPAETRAWFEQPDLATAWSGVEPKAEDDDEDDDDERRSTYRPPSDEGDSWEKHVAQARHVAIEGMQASLEGGPLGRMPADLVDVLAELAVAGPAVAMFRALDRVVGTEKTTEETDIVLRNGAGRTAWSFRSLFNQPEVTTMLRGGARGAATTTYWREVLRYCAEGCLQAVLDEYVHILRDHLGLMNRSLDERVEQMAEEIRDAVELRTSRVGISSIVVSESGRTVRSETKNLRTHFALRFADERNQEDGTVTRADQIRKAFNSPFWPFVLASTSVGQEGLDFHTYCHAVVHWNLPSNPVDLEQREGRVHRYKGHAVRRNVARQFGWAALEGDERDHWNAIFALARAEAKDRGATEIVPYWVYPVAGGCHIERHVLAMPLSREHAQASRLRSSLAVYRMVFGQPRQEDLVRHLLARLNEAELHEIARATAIDLSPSSAGS